MARELGGSQISALLEAVPGIRSVLRSPVADALVQMIRAGAGIDKFRLDSATELVEYSVRRGLINADEGDELMAEVKTATKKRKARSKQAAGAQKARPARKVAKKPAKKPAKKHVKKPARKPAKQPGQGKPARRGKKR